MLSTINNVNKLSIGKKIVFVFNFLINKKIKLILFLSFLIIQLTKAQTGQMVSLQKIVQPAPESAKFVNYFLTPISTSTGTSSIEIPIYTLEVDGFQLPISLSYHTSGIKVDDISGSVGLGWSLNAGGGIYRSINGQADDKDTNLGFLYNGTNQSFVDNINNHLWEHQTGYLATIANNSFDISQDSYYYNFANNSGALYFNSSLQFREARNRNFTFKYGTYPTQTNTKPEIDDITAVDKDGNSFFFNNKETGNTYNSTTPVGDPAVSVIGTTAWKISSIFTPGRKAINFEYIDYAINYRYVTGHTYTKRSPKTTIGSPHDEMTDCGRGDNSFSTTNTTFNNSNKLISKIATNHAIVQFYYVDDASLDIWKKKLDKIVISKAVNGEVIKTINFVYSTFQGNLTETAGTGLVTVGNTRLKLNQVTIKDANQVESQTYSFKYNEGVLPKIGSFAKDIFGYYNGALSNRTILSAYINGVNDVLIQSDRLVHDLYMKYGVLEEVTYPAGGKKRYTYGSNVDNGLYAPGLRVEKIEAINELGNVVNTKTFEYSMLNGLKTMLPCYSIGQSGRYNDRLSSSFNDIRIYSSSYTILSNISMPKNFYYGKAITREKGNDGKDLVTVENYGESNYVVFNGFSNYTEYNGEYQPDLHSIQYFKGENNPANLIKEHIYNYISFGDAIDDNVRYKGIAGQLGSGVIFTENDYTVLCSNVFSGIENDQYLASVTTVLESEEDRDYSSGTAVVSKTDYAYENPAHYFPTKITNHNSDNTTTEFHKKYVNDFQTVSPYDEMVSVHQISPVIEEKIIKSGIQLSLKKTNYYNYKPSPALNIYKPLSVQIQEKSGPLETRINYYDYDQWGNPTSLGVSDGLITNYVWSYGSSYPIAEIKDVDYTTIKAILGGDAAIRTFAAKLDPTVQELSNFLTPLKVQLPNAQITTFTYKPLVGMTSQTDAKGMTTYYEYDAFQRLKTVKDQNGNILKQTDYHYKTKAP